ncbi:hypothetical protein [uncultured Dysosmobacter sp.]|uniref:hypothetical protein n=1 Tax=uncultured Dysosmobacter sp. TaxID=2591384 RepID=UPI002672F9F3|nr:hypothetical protein [uncultured Dysosmobacter sp.]
MNHKNPPFSARMRRAGHHSDLYVPDPAAVFRKKRTWTESFSFITYTRQKDKGVQNAEKKGGVHGKNMEIAMDTPNDYAK